MSTKETEAERLQTELDNVKDDNTDLREANRALQDEVEDVKKRLARAQELEASAKAVTRAMQDGLTRAIDELKRREALALEREAAWLEKARANDVLSGAACNEEMAVRCNVKALAIRGCIDLLEGRSDEV